MKTIQPRKQRKMIYNAPIHKKRKWISSHLAENLLLKYDRRSASLIEGDTVKVMRGNFKGHEDKIAKVNVKDGYVEIEGITTIKADGKKIARPIEPSNLLITKLNLTDKWRRNKLEKGLSETTKKEIEKEAEEQIKEIEEQTKIEEKEKEETSAKEEEKEMKEEKLEEIVEKKEEKKQTPSDKKPATKKGKTTKKKTVKKAPSKTTKNKKEGEK